MKGGVYLKGGGIIKVFPEILYVSLSSFPSDEATIIMHILICTESFSYHQKANYMKYLTFYFVRIYSQILVFPE